MSRPQRPLKPEEVKQTVEAFNQVAAAVTEAMRHIAESINSAIRAMVNAVEEIRCPGCGERLFHQVIPRIELRRNHEIPKNAEGKYIGIYCGDTESSFDYTSEGA
jgi:DNA-directed RNA polymerase subunit RPC12/RpoP